MSGQRRIIGVTRVGRGISLITAAGLTVLGAVVAPHSAAADSSASTTAARAERSAPAPVTSTSTAFTGRVIVEVVPGRGGARIAARNLSAIGVVGSQTALSRRFALLTPRGAASPAAVAAKLRSVPGVRSASPEPVVTAVSTPNDSRYGEQWHLNLGDSSLHADRVWDRATGAGVTVAVVDTGRPEHEDLSERLQPGISFVTECGGSTTDVIDRHGHGTHVAGIIAATKDNGVGIAGVAPGATITPIKGLNCNGSGTLVAAAQGIVYAAGGSAERGVPVNPTPARVVNLSLGAQWSCEPFLQDAVDFARARGVVVVAAAGNDGIDASGFTPANCRGVVAVGASTYMGERAGFSNYGSTVDVMAPGLGILSLGFGARDLYAWMSGTSMASPGVVGAIADLLQVSPKLRPEDVDGRLRAAATGPCSECDTGVLNVDALVPNASAPLAPQPAPTATVPSAPKPDQPTTPAAPTPTQSATTPDFTARVTSVTPARGPVRGGFLITVKGSDLGGVASIDVGGTPLSIRSRNASMISGIAPAAPRAGAVDLTVRSAYGQSLKAGKVTYLPAPALTKLSRATAPKAGGTRIVVTGRNFTWLTKVTAGTTALRVIAKSATSVTVLSPRGALGARLPVRVVTAGGSSAALTLRLT